MTEQTSRWLLKVFKELKKHGKVEPVADFGGGRTIKRIRRILKEVGINNHVVYDIKNGHICLDLVKEVIQERYQTIICTDVLEHVTNPFSVAKNIYTGLQKGGIGIISAPFYWKKHGDDYFRFSKEGLLALFDGCNIENLGWIEREDKGYIRSSLIIKKL